MNQTHTLYAITHSLFSGRARAYLIKQGIPFVERSTGHESFKAEVLPKAKVPTIPTLVTPDGAVVRDGAEIIAHFESTTGNPCQPAGLKQRFLSALFDVIGPEGLLRPAMHFRWNFQADNLHFERYHFYHSQRDHPARDDKTDNMMGRMQQVARIWGVNEESIPLVEALYIELLEALNAHFEQQPYLFGWRPSIGDFGMLAPLYAHLGRDPYPARLMQQNAVSVYRWVERMNRADQDAPEFYNTGDDFLEDDQIPETLCAVLRVLAQDFLAETQASAGAINGWIDENGAKAGDNAPRMAGTCTFDVREQTITSAAQPYRFYGLQKCHAIYDAADETDRAELDALMIRCDLGGLMDHRLAWKGVFEDNQENWQAHD